jgi:hypothetical protein
MVGCRQMAHTLQTRQEALCRQPRKNLALYTDTAVRIVIYNTSVSANLITVPSSVQNISILIGVDSKQQIGLITSHE